MLFGGLDVGERFLCPLCPPLALLRHRHQLVGLGLDLVHLQIPLPLLAHPVPHIELACGCGLFLNVFQLAVDVLAFFFRDLPAKTLPGFRRA